VDLGLRGLLLPGLPAAAATPHRHAGRSSTGLVLVLAVALGIYVGVAGAVADGDRLIWLTANLPPVRLVEFVVGMLVGLQVREGRWRIPLPLASALAAASAGVTVLVPDSFATAAVTLVPYAVLLAALAHADLSGTRSPLRHGWVVRLGAWSYAIYLVHEIVLRGLRAGAPGATWWVVAAVALPLALVASGVVHERFERPVERLLRPIGRGTRTALPAHSRSGAAG
jgi:peptidoglycan/LPS O-acetylase OafA/YrhL